MKRPNLTIGMVACQMCEEVGAVRRDKSGGLYYVCDCGTHPAHGQKGRDWLMKSATIWGPEGSPPDDAPDWIKRGLAHRPGARSPFSRPRAPAPNNDAPSASAPGRRADAPGGAGQPDADETEDADELPPEGDAEPASVFGFR